MSMFFIVTLTLSVFGVSFSVLYSYMSRFVLECFVLLLSVALLCICTVVRLYIHRKTALNLGSCGLPHYYTPLVCVPKIQAGLAGSQVAE